MKTEVVLKLITVCSKYQVVWFNENRSCIEIEIWFVNESGVYSLMKTEVVLKLVLTSIIEL